ncbi:MAG: hypothetical protein RIQ46_1198 [Pseudomonadota bacterium]|jgi:hypothetical protein
MPTSDLGHEESRQQKSFDRRNRNAWWKRLMCAFGLGGAADYRRFEPFRPDVAMELAEAAHRREQELRRGLHRHRARGSGTTAD